MGATSNPRRALAGYLTVAAGIALLFGVVALAALRPEDGLAWVRLPQLGADFGLDPGLKTRPLRSTIVAEALQDRLYGSTGPEATLVIPPILAMTPPNAVPSAAGPGRPVAAGKPAPSPSAMPSPTPSPTASPTPAPTTSPTPTPTTGPTPGPTPPPTPSPTPCNRGGGVGAGTGNCKP
jgi:hypothetical protein